MARRITAWTKRKYDSNYVTGLASLERCDDTLATKTDPQSLGHMRHNWYRTFSWLVSPISIAIQKSLHLECHLG